MWFGDEVVDPVVELDADAVVVRREWLRRPHRVELRDRMGDDQRNRVVGLGLSWLRLGRSGFLGLGGRLGGVRGRRLVVVGGRLGVEGLGAVLSGALGFGLLLGAGCGHRIGGVVCAATCGERERYDEQGEASAHSSTLLIPRGCRDR